MTQTKNIINNENNNIINILTDNNNYNINTVTMVT